MCPATDPVLIGSHSATGRESNPSGRRDRIIAKAPVPQVIPSLNTSWPQTHFGIYLTVMTPVN